MHDRGLAGAALVLVLLVGCDDGGASCPAGATVACVCPGGATGTAPCTDDGTVGVCVCATDGGGPAPDAGGTDAGEMDAGHDAGADAGVADGGPCLDPVIAGFASNGLGGTDFGLPWSFEGEVGLAAGERACQAIGADHVCRYVEVLRAEVCGEFATAPASFWLHRETPVDVGGASVEAGPGARCNDWSGPIDHLADGEYVDVASDGTLTYHFDENPCFTGSPGDGCAAPGILSCNERRAIPCCR